ncbi:MAG: autotransporter outer membrane beta-barrel domain-containing protein [Steroidobacteraceae bacterium]
MPAKPSVLVAALTGCATVLPQAFAANAEFQNFFFDVCQSPTGQLAARCGETPAGLGNLSGDSESSLNPSQNIGHSRPALSSAQSRSKAVREKGEKLRDGGPLSNGDDTTAVAGPLSVLVNIHASWFERDSKDNASERNFDGDSRALEIGLDYRRSDRLVMGALVGYEKSDYAFAAEAPGVNFVPAASAGSADGKQRYLTVFGTWRISDRFYMELSAGSERGDSDFARNPVFQESTRSLPQFDVRVAGSASIRTNWASINAGFDQQRGAVSFGPYAGVTLSRTRIGSYEETDLNGSGLNMAFDASSRNSLLAHAGMRIGYSASSRLGVVLPQLRLEYQQELKADAGRATARFVQDGAATNYSFNGQQGDRNALNAGLSVACILPGGWMPFIDYSILVGSEDFDRQRATLGLRVEF